MKKILSVFVSLFFATAAVAQTNSGPAGGAVASVTGSCGVAVSPTTGATIASANVSDVAVSGTTDTITNTECGTVRRYTNAAAVTITVPSPSGFPTGFFLTIKSDGANTAGITVTPGTTIDGSASTITLTTDQSLDLYLNASSLWATLPGRSSGGGSGITALTGDCAASGTGSVTTNCNLGHPGFVSNFWYLQPGIILPSGSQNGGLTANTIWCSYSAIPKLVTVLALSTTVTVVGTSNAQYAIYANANGRPSTLIGNTGSIVNTSTGPRDANLVASKQIGPGGTNGGRDIWFCVNQNDSTAMYVNAGNTSYSEQGYIGASSSASLNAGANNAVGAVYCSGSGCTGSSSTFGAWPATLAGSTWNISQPGTTGQIVPVFQFQSQ